MLFVICLIVCCLSLLLVGVRIIWVCVISIVCWLGLVPIVSIVYFVALMGDCGLIVRFVMSVSLRLRRLLFVLTVYLLIVLLDSLLLLCVLCLLRLVWVWLGLS